jgi:putative transcriptional regulator
MPKAEITNQIRKLRFEHDEMSQTILLLEQGRYVPSLALALRIARVFGQTVEEVFQLEGDS